MKVYFFIAFNNCFGSFYYDYTQTSHSLITFSSSTTFPTRKIWLYIKLGNELKPKIRTLKPLPCAKSWWIYIVDSSPWNQSHMSHHHVLKNSFGQSSCNSQLKSLPLKCIINEFLISGGEVNVIIPRPTFKLTENTKP